MHSNELDNGITVIANGSDWSGDVCFVLPGGKKIETTWAKVFAVEEMYEALEEHVAANAVLLRFITASCATPFFLEAMSKARIEDGFGVRGKGALTKARGEVS